MLNAIKRSVVWQFAAGFAIGAIGLAALHPSAARAHVAPTHFVR